MRRICHALAVATASLLAAPSGLGQPLRPDWAPESRDPEPEPAPRVIFPREPERPAQLKWNYRRVNTDELLVTGGLGLVAVAAIAGGPTPGRWNGGVLFDDDVRRRARLGSYQARRRARDGSDVLLALSVSYPILGDGVLTSSWYHQSNDVAEQILLIDVETFAVTFAVQATVASLSSRERPYGEDCGGELDPELLDCERGDRYRSFFSGHASGAFAGASLSCMHHMHIPLYGGGAAEVASCVTGYAAATATAALRVAGDMHYASDVMLGAAWGTLAGLGVPWLLHYRLPLTERSVSAAPRVQLLPYPGGVAVGGAF